jgi:hypothetical protein
VKQIDHTGTRALDAGRFILNLVVDGVPRVVEMKTLHARRQATRWVTTGEHIEFDFPIGTSGYLVEADNGTNFKALHLSRCIQLDQFSAFTIRAELDNSDLRSGTVSVVKIYCTETGAVIATRTVEIAHGASFDTLPVPENARSIALALKLTGKGSLGMLRLVASHLSNRELRGASPRARQQQIKHFPKMAGTAAKQAESLRTQTVNAAVAARDYTRAISILTAEGDLSDNERKVLLMCYAAQRRFQDLIDCYRSYPQANRVQALTRLYFLQALANEQDSEGVRLLLEESAFSFGNDGNTLRFLVAAYPYSVNLEGPLKSIILSRLAGAAPQLRKSYNQLLRCAHDTFTDGQYHLFGQFLRAISEFDLSSAERARLHLLESHAAFCAGSYAIQMQALNEALGKWELYPLSSMAPNQSITFGQLECPSATVASVSGPMVTVLMTSFNSESTVEYAIRSIMGQTFSNIEILVIDDCSTDRTRELVLGLMQQDSRVRLIPLQRNSGTYFAKNQGLKEAQGDFVTCQDSDDWAHPQKIERMVTHLLRSGDTVAVQGSHVRYNPERGYQGRGGYIRPDASSLTYRRQAVVDRIGFYDTVRAGADSEFQFRMERAFGKDGVGQLPDLLSLVLWSDSSLSGGGQFAIDDDAGVFSPPRNAYRRAFVEWHERTDQLYMPFPATTRPFPVDDTILPSP